jgi:hypothetical protein
MVVAVAGTKTGATIDALKVSTKMTSAVPSETPTPTIAKNGPYTGLKYVGNV